MAKLKSLRPKVRTIDTSTTRLPPRYVDPAYGNPEFVAWRTAVKDRAGYRCEAVERGVRCGNAYPDHQMYADHIRELRDGGSLTDPANGQCLCASHHARKTHAERARRHRS